MNFGKWIVVTFVLFAMFMAVLVTLCVREDISLVSKDYYKEELKYQEQIERLNNTESLHQKPEITFDQHDLKVRWSENTKIEKGELELFCPSNASMDKRFRLRESSEQVFSTSSLKKGLYKVKLLWSMGGKEYYLEQEIFIG